MLFFGITSSIAVDNELVWLLFVVKRLAVLLLENIGVISMKPGTTIENDKKHGSNDCYFHKDGLFTVHFLPLELLSLVQGRDEINLAKNVFLPFTRITEILRKTCKKKLFVSMIIAFHFQ